MDEQIFFWINGNHNPFIDVLLWGLTTAAHFYLLWLGLGLVALFADAKNGKRALLGLFIALFLVYLSVEVVLKPLAERARVRTRIRRRTRPFIDSAPPFDLESAC